MPERRERAFVAICGDEPVLRSALQVAVIFAGHAPVAVGPDPRAVAAKVADPIDVLIVSHTDPVSTIKTGRALFPHAPVVAVDTPERAIMRRAFHSGASAFVPRHVDAGMLREVLDHVIAGRVVARADDGVLAPADLSYVRFGITRAEHRVLEALSSGASNEDIARSLHLATKTVMKHVAQLLKRTRTANRTQLAVLAVREHLIAEPSRD